jgi:hypothetical protein
MPSINDVIRNKMMDHIPNNIGKKERLPEYRKFAKNYAFK